MQKISIITVNFNNKNGLYKTIESVQKQTYSNIEYIVIDGGSDAFKDSWDDAHKEALDKAFKEAIVDNRVRAITCIGLTIPYEYYKKYSLIYVFNYNMETSQLSCIKSN